DVSGTPHSQAPQKPIRRKYHPESQNLETGPPPPAMPFPPPAKPSQKLVKDLNSDTLPFNQAKVAFEKQ
ncbi:hypothetical protein XENORESO_009816, partial [Xenotaenia resolanae]